MHLNLSKPLERAFFPLSILLLAGLVVAVGQVVGVIMAIKGSYALLGLTIAALCYYGSRAVEGRTDARSLPVENLDLGVAGVAAAAVAGAVVVPDRGLVLLLTLPLGYALLALQFRGGVGTRRLLAQVTALFLVSPVTVYLTTGFFFSHGDTFTHVRLVEALLASGFPGALGNYSTFPGLHSVAATLSLLGGVAPYDALMMFGIAAFASVVPLTYLLARLVSGDDRLALAVALGLSLLEPIGFFATYFFPQSLAVVLAYVLLYLAYRGATEGRAGRRRVTALTVLLGAAIVLTHHLTLVLLMPVLVGLYALPRLAPLFAVAPHRVVKPRVIPVFGVLAAALVYWIVNRTFIVLLVGELAVLLLGQRTVASASSAVSETVAFGTRLPAADAAVALRSLGSPEGIYYVALVAVFCFGVAVALRTLDHRAGLFGLLAAGVISAPLLFRTPIAVEGITRARLPVSLFFAFVLGVGLYALLTHARGSRAWTAGAVALVVVLGTTAPVVASGDLYGLHGGPDLYEVTPVPETQVEYTAAEYASLRATSGFVEANGGSVTTFAASRHGIEHFGTEADTDLRIDETGVSTPESLVLYRDRWADHGVRVGNSELTTSTVVMGDAWLRDTVTREQKVYDTGHVGLLWNENGGRIGGAATE